MMTLQDIVIGSEIHEYDCLASTNDKAKELAHSGCANGTVIVACQQTAGRGQGQHTWYSRSDAGMYFSVVIRPQRSDIEIQYYSLMTGVALNSALRGMTGVESLIKWPNDILVNGRKLAGILCEAGWQDGAVEYVVLGIGINISHGAADFPDDLVSSATSLAQEHSRTLDKQELLSGILKQLDIWYKMTSEYGFEAIITLYEAQKYIA